MSGVNPYGSFILQGLYGGKPSTANALTVQNAQIIDVPTTLKNLANNLILKGEVTSQRSNGEAVITTNRGDISVKLQNQLPVGSKVDIQIPSGQNPREAIVQPTLAKAIQQKQDGHTNQIQQQSNQPQTASTATIADVKNLQTTATQASQNIANTLSTLTIGQSVRITPLPVAQQNALTLQAFSTSTPLPLSTTFLTPPPQGTAQVIVTPTTDSQVSQQSTTVSTPPPLSQTGALAVTSLTSLQSNVQQTPTLVPVRVIISPPLTAHLQPSIPTSLVNNQAPMTLPATQTPQSATITTAQLPPPATRSDASVTHLRAPSPQITTSSLSQNQNTRPPFTLVDPIANSGQIIATATGFVNDDGNPIIQTLGANNQVQLSTLHYPARNLPAGTQIVLTPLPSGSLKAPQQTLSWQNFTQFTETLGQIFPTQISQSLLNLLPTPTQPKAFPAAALLFLAAAKGGDLSAWLGTRVTRGADHTKAHMPKKLLETLMRDISTQTGRAATPTDPPMVQSNPDWRAHILPLMVGTDIHHANLWTKDDNNQNNPDNDKETGTRFIVDLTLSRMGDVYFDGFINKNNKIFDLSVITERAITPPMQNTIKSIWYKTLGGLDLDGNILFKEIT